MLWLFPYPTFCGFIEYWLSRSASCKLFSGTSYCDSTVASASFRSTDTLATPVTLESDFSTWPQHPLQLIPSIEYVFFIFLNFIWSFRFYLPSKQEIRIKNNFHLAVYLRFHISLTCPCRQPHISHNVGVRVFYTPWHLTYRAYGNTRSPPSL